jgi:hypothetical protein
MYNKMKKILFISVLFILALVACSDPNDGTNYVTPTEIESEMTTADYLENNKDNYSLWIEFLKYADYYNALKDASATATVFCPTNDAVRKFLKWRGVDSISNLSKEYAQAVVKEHIIANVSVNDASVNTYAEDSTYIPSQTLFGSYLSLNFGYTITDVDDAERKNTRYVTDSIFINNQARLEKFTAVKTANGIVFTMGDVIHPLAETIMDKLDAESDYSIFAAALHECGFDKTASLLQDTTYVVGGGYVVNKYMFTCLAVPNSAYQKVGVTDVASLKSYLLKQSPTEPSDSVLYHYAQYHFLPREYKASELFDFKEEGQTLVFDTKYTGHVFISNNVAGADIINNSISILRSDVDARNGKIDKINDAMPIFNPNPVTIIWDFCNTSEIAAFVNAYGAAKNLGNLFSSPLTGSEVKVDLSENKIDGNYGELTGFTYVANSSKAKVANYRTVGFYKEKYASVKDKTVSKYGSFMNNYLMLNLGYAGWFQTKTPTIIAGKYRIELHYCSDVTLNSFYSAGSLTRFTLDDDLKNVYLYKGLASTLRTASGVVTATLWDSKTFETSGSHTFKATMMDINAKTSALYHQMYDYVKFIPIE